MCSFFKIMCHTDTSRDTIYYSIIHYSQCSLIQGLGTQKRAQFCFCTVQLIIKLLTSEIVGLVLGQKLKCAPVVSPGPALGNTAIGNIVLTMG